MNVFGSSATSSSYPSSSFSSSSSSSSSSCSSSSSSTSSTSPDQVMAATEELRKLVLRLENVTNRFEGLDLTCLKSDNFQASVAPASASAVSAAPGALQNGVGAPDAGSQFVSAFDEIVEGPLAEFHMYARRIESEVLLEQVELVVKSFKLQRDFLAMASQCRPPATQADLTELLKPTSDSLMEAVGAR